MAQTSSELRSKHSLDCRPFTGMFQDGVAWCDICYRPHHACMCACACVYNYLPSSQTQTEPR